MLFHETEQLVDVTNLVAMEGRTLSSALDLQIEVLAVALVAIGPSILFAGLVFPILLASVTTEKSSATGKRWAMLLAINGIGGLLGALAAEYLLVPSVGIYGGMIVAGILQAIAAIAIALALRDWQLLIPGAVTGIACLALFPGSRRDSLHHSQELPQLCR